MGKQAGTRQGTVHDCLAARETFSPLPDDWHSAEAVGRGGRISQLLRANLSQGIFIRNLGGKALSHVVRPRVGRGQRGGGGRAVLGARAQRLGTRHSSEAVSIEALQPDANQRQMWLGNKRHFAAICPPQLRNLGYASWKNLAKSYPRQHRGCFSNLLKGECLHEDGA